MMFLPFLAQQLQFGIPKQSFKLPNRPLWVLKLLLQRSKLLLGLQVLKRALECQGLEPISNPKKKKYNNVWDCAAKETQSSLTK